MNKQKATTEQLIESYNRTGSVWKTAEEFNMCGQSVHQRLQKINSTKSNRFSEDEKNRIISFYGNDNNLPKDLNKFAQELKRPKTNICRYARSLGLTSLSRKRTESYKKSIVSRMKKQWKEKPHPRGMLGKKHSKEYCAQISLRASEWWKISSEEVKRKKILKSQKTKLKKYGTLASKREKVSWKQGWRTINNKQYYFRSRWEANYALVLEYLKCTNQIKDWIYEDKTFFFDDKRSVSYCYIPDFKVIYNDNSYEWHEVKGWFDDRSIKKINDFKKYFPNEKLIIIDSLWFKNNSKYYSSVINEWEL